MAKNGHDDCEAAGSGIYNTFCEGRFTKIDKGIEGINGGIVHVRKILLGDPVEHLEGVVPVLNRHEEYIEEQKKKNENEEKQKRTDRRCAIGAVVSAIAALAAAALTIFS